jgi:7,8-dihydropterin-6-yl-methyl-4-(beta-D-ribofuranosyl)aminobenzene 5'-phosphate synthase
MSGQAREDFLISRRNVPCGGGASALIVMIAALLGDTQPARAETISGSVPEIDALAVRVVVDSYQFAVAPSRTQEGVEIQHFGWGIRKDSPPGRTLVSEFGLAMHVESRRGTQT